MGAVKVKMEEVSDNLQKIHSELSFQFVERDEALKSILISILSGHHCYLLGPYGSAKTALIKAVASRIDAKLFHIPLHRQTTEERLFGNWDLAKIREENVWEHKTENTLVDAEICILDEAHEGSSALLNTLLPVLNEREVRINDEMKQLPLLSAFGVSTEALSDQELSPLWDRFLIRVYVDYVQSNSNFIDMLQTPAEWHEKKTTIELKDLQYVIRNVIPHIPVPMGILHDMADIREEFRNQELNHVSDRRWRWTLDILRASAFFHGRQEVNELDTPILYDALWDMPEQRKDIKKIIDSICNKDLLTVEAFTVEVTKMSAEVSEEDKTRIKEFHVKLKTVRDQVSALIPDMKMNADQMKALDELVTVGNDFRKKVYQWQTIVQTPVDEFIANDPFLKGYPHVSR